MFLFVFSSVLTLKLHCTRFFLLRNCLRLRLNLANAYNNYNIITKDVLLQLILQRIWSTYDDVTTIQYHMRTSLDGTRLF